MYFLVMNEFQQIPMRYGNALSPFYRWKLWNKEK